MNLNTNYLKDQFSLLTIFQLNKLLTPKKKMVMQNKALICASYVPINSQYASNMHANKKPVNSEN